jgi:hypothetical protein
VDGDVVDCRANDFIGWLSADRQGVVLAGYSSTWQAYFNGDLTGVEVSWFGGCGVAACTISALAEMAGNVGGIWKAKFAGDGNIPWQFMYSGGPWTTCCNPSFFANTGGPFARVPTPPWTGPYGDYPIQGRDTSGGMWWIETSAGGGGCLPLLPVRQWC